MKSLLSSAFLAIYCVSKWVKMGLWMQQIGSQTNREKAEPIIRFGRTHFAVSLDGAYS